MFTKLNCFNKLTPNYIDILKKEVNNDYELYEIKKINKINIKNYNKNNIIIKINTNFNNFLELKKEYIEIKDYIKNLFKTFYKNFNYQNNHFNLKKNKNKNIFNKKDILDKKSLNEFKFNKKNTFINVKDNKCKINFNFINNHKIFNNNFWSKKTSSKKFNKLI